MTMQNTNDEAALPPTPCSAPSVVEILYTHPSESFYHDNTIWFPHPFCETGSGLWLKPGQAIAIINLPNAIGEARADIASPPQDQTL